jgi:hypothetical protein
LGFNFYNSRIKQADSSSDKAEAISSIMTKVEMAKNINLQKFDEANPIQFK